jgi:hypothetical protein
MREQTEQYLLALEEELLSEKNRYIIIINHEWIKQIPNDEGIFLLREEGDICYIESTSNIQNCLTELLINRKHGLRNKLAISKLKREVELEKNNSNVQFSELIELELDNILQDNFELSYILITVGKTELCNRIIEKSKPSYNTKISQNLSEKAYSVEEIRKNHGKAYMPWTSKDDDELWQLNKLGKSICELALLFGRKNGAITSRLAKLEFSKNEKY